MTTSPEHRQTLGVEVARNFRDERQLWRERTLGGLLASTFVAVGFAALWYLVVPHSIPVVSQLFGATAVILGVLLLARRRLPFVLSAAVFLVGVYAACLGATLFIGFTPNALVGYSTVAVAAALLFGRTPAILAVGMGALAILGVSLAHDMGLVQRVPFWSELVDSSDLSNGVRVTGIFTLISASSVVGVSYLLERSGELAVRQVQSLRELRKEQLDKERLRHDLELREAALTKARELETLGRLAGSMAHDFNNALLVIWASIEELSEHPELASAGREALSALRAAAEQGAATTRNLRAFGPLAPRRSTTLVLAPVIARAKATLARVLPPNIVLEADIQVDVAVTADEGELLRVLTNLALNARDAMRDGGRIILRVRPASDAERGRSAAGQNWVAIDVADTGSGMAEDVKRRLFEPFFTTKDAGGTGLGLATVRDIARAYGGEVAVASQLGEGTTITVLWPISVEPAVPSVLPAASSTASGSVVLLVDDDLAVLSALGKSLTRAGFTVVEASSASAGLEILGRGELRIQVLCTDWMMPGRPVRDLIDEFQRLHGGPVLVCSGYAPAETGISAELVDDFLEKPFSGDDLVRRIQRLLAEQQRE